MLGCWGKTIHKICTSVSWTQENLCSTGRYVASTISYVFLFHSKQKWEQDQSRSSDETCYAVYPVNPEMWHKKSWLIKCLTWANKSFISKSPGKVPNRIMTFLRRLGIVLGRQIKTKRGIFYCRYVLASKTLHNESQATTLKSQYEYNIQKMTCWSTKVPQLLMRKCRQNVKIIFSTD